LFFSIFWFTIGKQNDGFSLNTAEEKKISQENNINSVSKAAIEASDAIQENTHINIDIGEDQEKNQENRIISHSSAAEKPGEHEPCDDSSTDESIGML
jgi:beta-lactam-binding protein with PASTA domain